MAHQSFISIDGKDSRLNKVIYKLDTDLTPSGKPSSVVNKIVIEIWKDSTLDKGKFIKWMNQNHKGEPGREASIVIKDAKGDEFKKIDIKNGIVIEYEETVAEGGSANSVERFKIVAEIATVDGNEFKFFWPSED